MPTANAEDTCRSGGAERRDTSHQDLSGATLRPDLPLGPFARRRAAKKWSKNRYWDVDALASATVAVHFILLEPNCAGLKLTLLSVLALGSADLFLASFPGCADGEPPKFLRQI